MTEGVLVTGASGFIGVSLSETLRSAGYTVYGHAGSTGDIAHYEFVFPTVKHVFHLAAKTYVPDSWTSPFEFYRVNFLGTVNVLEFCRRQGASITFVSSYVYGKPETLPIRESHPIRAFNPYSHTKILAEEVVSYYNSQFGVPASIVRPFNVYGPGQKDCFLIPTLIRQALDESSTEIVVSDLRPRRDYIFVRDLVGLLMATRTRLDGQVYNGGSGQSVAIEDLTTLISSLTCTFKPLRSRSEERPEEVFDVVADISKAESELKWRPSVLLREGLRETIQWMRGPAA